MKTKLIGLGILAVVILAAVAYAVFGAGQRVTEIHGYVGGEKVGLLEDEEVADILRDRYRLSIDYAKAGSIDMVTEDTSRISSSPPTRRRWSSMNRRTAARSGAKSS